MDGDGRYGQRFIGEGGGGGKFLFCIMEGVLSMGSLLIEIVIYVGSGMGMGMGWGWTRYECTR